MIKLKHYFFIILALFFLFFGRPVRAENDARNLPKLLIFFSPGCHRCQVVKAQIMPGIENEFRGRVSFEYLNLDNVDNYRLLISLKDKTQPGIKFEIPLFYLNGSFINSEGNIHDKLRMFMLEGLKKQNEKYAQAHINLVEYFKQLAPLAVIIAGLQDGFNPCAFTVIIFFMSFLAFQGYRRKELFLIGAVFIFAVFFTYVLIGLGIFNFLYGIRNFWRLIRAINLVVGASSIALGLFSLYDFFKFRRTADTNGLILQLPQTIKNRIHALIGFYYRLENRGLLSDRQSHRKDKLAKPRIFRLVLSALITGFLVCLLEAVCTGQAYLPTLVFIFKNTSLKLHALSYILLYNMMFVIPLIIIFILSLAGFTSSDFAKFTKRHLGLIKILMAVLFFTLGILLIRRS